MTRRVFLPAALAVVSVVVSGCATTRADSVPTRHDAAQAAAAREAAWLRELASSQRTAAASDAEHAARLRRVADGLAGKGDLTVAGGDALVEIHDEERGARVLAAGQRRLARATACRQAADRLDASAARHRTHAAELDVHASLLERDAFPRVTVATTR